MTLGYAAVLGFHIWEIVDVWTGARPYDDEKKASFMILPARDSFQAAVAFRF